MDSKLADHYTLGKLLKFTVPSICMMIVTSIYGVVDGIFVSNIVGSQAFAAVNLIMPFLMILGTLGFMVGTGGSALVSRTLGQGDKKRALEYFSMLIEFVLVMGIVFSVLGAIFMRPIAVMLGAAGEILDQCVIYGRILMISLTGFMLQNAFQSFLVVAEKPRMGLAISIASGLTNLVGDFLFIYVFRLGIAGAAAATAMGEWLGGLVPMIYFLCNCKGSLHLKLTKIELRPIGKACFNGVSEMLSNIAMSLVTMLYNLQLLKLVGSDGVVAFGIIMYISFIFAAAFIGYSIGSAPIVGYNYGAGNKKELHNVMKKSYGLIVVTGIVMCLAAEILSNVLAGIFVGYDAGLQAMTSHAIRIYSLSFLLCGISIYTSNFFTALSNGVISAVISFMRTLVFQVIMIYALPVIFGLDGIWGAVVAAEALSVILSVIMLLAHRKKYGYF